MPGTAVMFLYTARWQSVNVYKLEQDRQHIYIKHNLEVRLCNYCCYGKAVCIKYSECVFVALVIQHAKHMHFVILSTVASPALLHFFTLSHKWHSFKKNCY
jgi:hypothetical protein